MKKIINIDYTIIYLLSSAGIYRLYKGYPYLVAGIRILLNPHKYDVTDIDQLYEKLQIAAKSPKIKANLIRKQMEYMINSALKKNTCFLTDMLKEKGYSLNDLDVWTFLVSATEWILWHNAIYIKSDPYASWDIVWDCRQFIRKQSTIPSRINISKY